MAAKEEFQALYGTEHPMLALRLRNVDKALFPSAETLFPGDPRLLKFGLRYINMPETGKEASAAQTRRRLTD
jgi:hypothetical protein